MAKVNSRGETCLSERGFELPAQPKGAQPAAEKGGIPGLFRADTRAESEFAQVVLAEGEELSSNLSALYFKGLVLRFI